MKFKTIFLAFNIILLFSFVFIFFMPFFILGGEYTRLFWSKNWYLGLAFLLVLVGLNAYFLLRWKLFTLLEAEDWKGARDYLEKKIFQRKKPTDGDLRILINTYLVLADAEGIGRLEKFLCGEKSRHHSKFALELGLPFLMKNEPEAMEAYFEEAAGDAAAKKKAWIRWYLAFARMVLRKPEAAREDLADLSRTAADPVLRLLALYLLGGFDGGGGQVESVVKEGRDELRKKYSAAAWEKEVERSKGNLEVLVLMKLVKDAGDWLFAAG